MYSVYIIYYQCNHIVQLHRTKCDPHLKLSSSYSRIRHSWTWYLIPMNAGNSGIGTITSLYMLQIGGTVKEVAICAFLTGLGVTIGCIFWGKMIDIMHLRGIVIIISSASMAILAILINLVSTVESLILISVSLGFLTSGAGSVLNLLVMEKSRKEVWLKTFNWTSMISCAGIVVAMVTGYLWLQHHDIKSYATVCAVISLSSLMLAIVFVKDKFSINTNATFTARSFITAMAKQYKRPELSFCSWSNPLQLACKIKRDKEFFSLQPYRFIIYQGIFSLHHIRHFSNITK
jgi:MFS family permease